MSPLFELFPAVLAMAAQSAPESRAAPIDARGVSTALARIASEHPDVASVLPVAVSRGGRKIEALRLATGERGPGRPAILVVANLEGPFAWTSGLALDEARELAARRASDPKIAALLASTTIYVVPCANPDAAEARFATPLAEQRATAPFMDDDRDGRIGEDGPSDVDGDGLVLQMRKLDPDGEWIADPADARAMIKADRARGERGKWKLFVEGRDSDRDEKAGEDPELDVQVARNFPHGWREHTPEAGTWPTSEPESRGLCDFVLAHRDVQLVVVLGAQDDLAEKPKSAEDKGRSILTAMPEEDAKTIGELGKRWRALGETKTKGEGDEHGTFQAWCKLERGVWVVSSAPWSMPLDQEAKKNDAPKPDEPKKDEATQPDDKSTKKPDAASSKKKDEDKREPSDDAKRLRWIDAKSETARFVAWKPFTHPELGAVEIGGWAPYALVEPPESERAAIFERALAFTSSLGDVLARVAIVDAKAKDLGGVWEVKAAVENAALFAFPSAAGRRTGAVRPVRVTLVLPQSAKLLAGEKQTLVRELAGSGGRKELTWLVQGAAPTSIAIEADTDCAGHVRATPEVTK